MREKAHKLCLIGLLAGVAAGCIEHEGQLAVLLSGSGTAGDANLAAQQVNVEVTSVDLREGDSGSYVTLAAGSQVYELLTLDDSGNVLAMASGLTEGAYTHVRLIFSETGSFVINDAGRRRPLRIEPLTLEIPVLATVVEDTTADIELVLDTGASLSLKGNGEYWLRPIVRQSLQR